MRSFVRLKVLFFLALPMLASAQVVIIVHPSNGIEKIDAETAEGIYTLSTRKWSDGTKIQPYNVKASSNVKKSFFEFLDKSAAELRKTWLRLQFTGRGMPPKAVKTEEELVKIVASTPGAIAYVSSNLVGDSVKVVHVIDE